MDDLYGLLNAYSFDVEIDGSLIGFKSVKGLKLSAAFEPLQVGGMNDGPVMLPVPVREEGRITFERGKYKKKSSQLPRPGTLVKDITILLYDEDDSYKAEYILESPAVESIELGSLDALSSEILIETFTVSFRHITEKNY